MLKYILNKNIIIKSNVISVLPIFELFFVISLSFYSCNPVRKSESITKQDHVNFHIQDSLSQIKIEYEKKPSDSLSAASDTILSAASKLLIKACNNYLFVDSNSTKIPEVLTIKASVYYNNRQFEESRAIYKKIISMNSNSQHALDAMRMIAQSYYEEKKFDKAQHWYRKLTNSAPEGIDKFTARSRIAESIFRMAELLEEQKKYEEAADKYQRIAMEFPESKIADMALFNAGLDYEKNGNWSKAILVFQNLKNKFKDSKLIPNAQFRIARCNENLAKWEQAAHTYLQIAAKYPNMDLASVSLYNAAICFENGKKYREAASTFEKFAEIYKNTDEAADALFKAGEIYGQIKDWPSVQRVNQAFMKHFGNDKSRIVQAHCMTGVAFYMQDQTKDALKQLQKAFDAYNENENSNTVNSFYAAKALFTIGEIYSKQMTEIKLKYQYQYRQQLTIKSKYLNQAIDAFTKVVKIGIAEWTSRSIFQAGQTYEDFANGIFKQERPSNQPLSDRLSLELGIAQAVEKYLISNALHYHERNVKFALKEQFEDKYILQSRQKLTQLPFIAGKKYLTLAEIASQAENNKKLDGFALMANKLQILQKIAPFQARAIDLFLKCLELGTTYQEFNEFYKKTSNSITNVSLVIGNTYADVVKIARSAPIPAGFDNYEKFVYKTKLLSRIEEYENEAVTNYLKTIKISSAYGIEDKNVTRSKEKIAEILFNRARCYDLLCIQTFTHPPFPSGISESVKDEYKVQFEEIGLKFQEQAFKIYETILDYYNQKIASGEFVIHSYVRLFQNYPEKYGKKVLKRFKKNISSGQQWKYTTNSDTQWYKHDFIDSSWESTKSKLPSDSISISGFPDSVFEPIIFDTIHLKNKVENIYIRQSFYLENTPSESFFHLAADGLIDLYINGKHLSSDSISIEKSRRYDLTGKLKRSKNVLAIKLSNYKSLLMYPLLVMNFEIEELQPYLPDQQLELTSEQVQIDTYEFPHITNFSLKKEESGK